MALTGACSAFRPLRTRARLRASRAALAYSGPPPPPAAPPAPPCAPRLPAVLDVGAFVSDRQRADPRFLQKIGIEVGVDSACTAAAELVARGAAAFGAEWVYVVDDLVTTVLLDVAMVSILAPSAAKNEARGGGVQPASPATSADAAAPGGAVAAVADAAAAPAEPLGASGAALAAAGFPGLGGAWLRQATELAAAATAALSALPNSCFAAAPPPPHPGYSLPQRAGAALWTAVLYGALGLVCGGAGQALTNALTRVAPAVGPATLPGVVPVALLWAQYMAFSASLRYQLVGAAENLAERAPGLGGNAAALAATSLLLRLCNNVYGAGLFVELMKDSGISP